MEREGIKSLFEAYSSYKNNNEIFHDLMQYKVKEILLVATLYDAFILEQEGQLTERIFGEYYKLSLPDAPRITNVSSGEDACNWLKKERFDMVILTMRIDGMSPYELKDRIKQMNKDIPVVILLNDNGEIPLIHEKIESSLEKDLVFVWNGDSKVFLAMIKYVEDKMNLERDTRIGLVRVILLVEDSVRYVSRYLPLLYTEIMKQTQRLIVQENLDEMRKLLRLRARPKVIIVSNYEDAIEFFNKYKDYILTVISDMKYPKENEMCNDAGYDLIKYIKKAMPEIPCLIQSFEQENSKKAKEVGALFINKNSDQLITELRSFIFNNLGFGTFIFRDKKGRELARASSIDSFKKILSTIPAESLVFHAQLNQFSAWLMARGEIQIAKKLQKKKVDDFSSVEGLRDYLIDICVNIDKESVRGRVIKYNDFLTKEEENIVQIAEGSLGGKGRGIAFANNLIQNTSVASLFPEVNIRLPKTVLIGTEEFKNFIDRNKLENVIHSKMDYLKLRKRFLKGELSRDVVSKLKKKIKYFQKPLAVRSSSLFEDSISQSFSGVFETYLIPNNHRDPNVRLDQLLNAIKLVYASVFSPSARAYFNAINYKIEEEKMAVIIQDVVGDIKNEIYYPHFSGVMQSDNYYPISHLKTEDGISEIAVGLGKYVIEGNDSFRFCPKYPNIDVSLSYKSQKYFYAIDMKEKEKLDLISGDDSTMVKMDMERAERDGMLDYIASVYDVESGEIINVLSKKGPRIINFNQILKYDYFPLSEILETLSSIVKISIGTSTEIEFAVDLDKSHNGKISFYILQIKPIIRKVESLDIAIDSSNKNDLLLFTETAMGNGKIDDITDILYIDDNDFDRMKTVEIVKEIESINREYIEKGKRYILIGPGRWGTRDPFMGIPVIWSQISNARIIVETDMSDFSVDPSLGSHFFHNVVSMNVGYFTVFKRKTSSFIDIDWLRGQKGRIRRKYVTEISFEKPIKVLMNGIKGTAAIFK
jgi:CheY-like chemotaxis protein